MKLKLTLKCLLLTVCIYQTQIFAQVSNFNLANYKLPYLKRHLLETNINLSGNNNYYELPVNDKLYTDKDNNLNSNVNIKYNLYLNSITTQRQINSEVNYTSYYNKRSGNNYNKPIERYNNNPLINFSIENRHYFKPNLFIETDVNTEYSYKKEFSNSYVSNNSINHTILFETPIKLGIGRVERVEDARQAIYIYDELSKQGRLKDTINNDDVIKFATKISELKNKRFFDYRIRRIYEIEALDTFLKQNNYISQSDARYFTTLSDYWVYANSPIRNSGTRISFGIYPNYYLNDKNQKIENDNTYNYNLNTLILNGGIELLHEKPINNYWQNTIEIKGLVGKVLGVIKKDNSKISIPNIQLNYSQTIGYYPNTRTIVSLMYGANYVQLFGDNNWGANNSFGANSKGFKIFTNLAVQYYISPQVKLLVSSSVFYINQKSEYKTNLYFNETDNSKTILYLLSNESNYYYATNSLLNDFRITLLYSIF